MNRLMVTADDILAFAALLLIGGLGVLLVFIPVPQPNAQEVTFILGALSGALTVGAGKKVADKVTTQTGNIVQGGAE